MNTVGNNTLNTSVHLIRDGVYGATVTQNNEPIYLRMERLTEENRRSWSQYSNMNYYIARGNTRGILDNLVCNAERLNYADLDETTMKVIGFTKEEYNQFTERALAFNKKKPNMYTVINSSVGTAGFCTYPSPEEQRYVVYATKNPHYSILGKSDTISLKNYIESYGDILISVGSDFTDKNSFHNRGIFRNPWWVFQEKYAGLSMLLHGFSAAVAEKFYPEKETMVVTPVGSMQVIISKNLQKGDGYRQDYQGKREDLTDIIASPDDGEGPTNYIKASALTRIFNRALEANN